MKNAQKRILFLGILILILFNSMYVWYHEEAHSKINLYYGCSSSEISYYGLYGVTTPTECPKEYFVYRYYLHSVNEIVGYHFMIGLNFVIFLVILFWIKKEGERNVTP